MCMVYVNVHGLYDKYYLFCRLSLKYEPSRTPEIRKRHTHHTIITPLSTETQLRTSKSYEDLLTQQAAEELGEADTESPFASNQRNRFMRRSLNANPAPSPAKNLKRGVYKRSVPGLNEPFASQSVEVKKVTTLPNSFREPPLIPSTSHSHSKLPDVTKPIDLLSPPLASSPTSAGGHPPSAPQRPFPSSPLSHSKVKGGVRGHKKSSSLGSKSR